MFEGVLDELEDHKSDLGAIAEQDGRRSERRFDEVELDALALRFSTMDDQCFFERIGEVEGVLQERTEGQSGENDRLSREVGSIAHLQVQILALLGPGEIE